jgi:hypothetical protein
VLYIESCLKNLDVCAITIAARLSIQLLNNFTF